MTATRFFRPASSAALAVAALSAGSARAHEAWLLTPDEVAALAVAPMPEIFQSPLWLGLAAVVASVVAAIALTAEDRLAGFETRLFAPLRRQAAQFGPLILRIGLAAMLALGALGALPRAGTKMLAEPVLFVPDMQLGLAAGWGLEWHWLAAPELGLALLLVTGLATRAAAGGVIALALAGFAAFGLPFMNYAAHFVAPAMLLMVYGGGALSADRLLGRSDESFDRQRADTVYRVALTITGLTFVWLGITCKLTQPTLLIAILEHGQVPLLGLPVAFAALVMAGVEIGAGALIACGRLTRPLALVLMGAFTFFAVTLGETPLLHANLYALMMFLLMAGRRAPRPGMARRSVLRPALV